MADYAIGDIQGCYEPLMRLLELVNFDPQADRLWFVGDLVNRGPDSLAVLRFIQNLQIPPRIVLGNHDLYLIARFFDCVAWVAPDDTLDEILQAPHAYDLIFWLKNQNILYHDEALDVVMTHAGVAPTWNLPLAKELATELETVLQGEDYKSFLRGMYGNFPQCWSETLKDMDRLRVICNYFTRMRFCDARGCLIFDYDGPVEEAPSNVYPWYNVPNRYDIAPHIVFGHWAALLGKCVHPRIHAIDTGCYWGGQLTAIRLQDKHRFSVAGQS